MKKNYVKNLCLCAVLSALCFALDYCTTVLNSATGFLKLPLSAFPIIIAAVMCGPFMGTAVGLVGTFLTQLITYGITPTTLLWILPAGIRGLCVGLLFTAFGKSLKRTALTAEIIISSVIVTALNTLVIYLDSVFYGYYTPAVVWGGFIARTVTGITASAVFAMLVPSVIKILRQHMK